MIYLLGGVSFLIQILCVLHAVRTGRNQIWIWVILIGSMLGCTAYFAFEIMPELFGPGSKYARTAQAKIESDGVHQLRQAETALAQVDSAASRSAMGDAHKKLGAYHEAALQYQIALDRMNGNDAKIETKLAQALFDSGKYDEALRRLDHIPAPNAIGELDRLAFLRARILGELGQREEAAAIYTDIVTRLPGEEAHCRYAALLLEMDRPAEARFSLEAVERLIKQRPLVSGDPAMIAWAKEQLTRLRAA